MIKREDVFKIGRLGKPYGIRGEISFQFDDDIFDRVESEYLILDMDGILVPFFIEEYRFRKSSVAALKFQHIDSQERAAELTGADVYFPRALAEEEDELPTLEMLVDFDIIDAETGKTIGSIASVDKQTVNILFELEDGRLIPANVNLIKKIDTDNETITMTLPEGLLSLS